MEFYFIIISNYFSLMRLLFRSLPANDWLIKYNKNNVFTIPVALAKNGSLVSPKTNINAKVNTPK